MLIEFVPCMNVAVNGFINLIQVLLARLELSQMALVDCDYCTKVHLSCKLSDWFEVILVFKQNEWILLIQTTLNCLDNHKPYRLIIWTTSNEHLKKVTIVKIWSYGDSLTKITQKSFSSLSIFNLRFVVIAAKHFEDVKEVALGSLAWNGRNIYSEPSLSQSSPQ